MSTTTFVSGLTTAVPAHPGVIPATGTPRTEVEAWECALAAHEAAKAAAERCRKFAGRASDESIRRWAQAAGIASEVTVRVITHTGQAKWGAYTESSRTVSL